MSLVKKAAGMQRFMLDCGWWRSPKWDEPPSLEEAGLFQAVVSYCTEHATDGRLPSDDEGLALRLGFRLKEVRRAKRALLARGVLREDGGLCIPGWADHNPTRQEVEDHRARRAAASEKANHERHHRSKPNPECRLCADAVVGEAADVLRIGSGSDSGSDPTPAPKGAERSGAQSSGEDGLETPQSSVSGGPRRAGPVDDDGLRTSVFVAACRVLAEWDFGERTMPDVVARHGDVGSVEAWTAKALNRRITRHRAQWHAMGSCWGLSAEALAERLRTAPVVELLAGGGSDCTACEQCGARAVCESCNGPLSADGDRLACGSCGPRPKACDECGSTRVRWFDGPVLYERCAARSAEEARRFKAEGDKPVCANCGDRDGRGWEFDPAAEAIVPCRKCNTRDAA